MKTGIEKQIAGSIANRLLENISRIKYGQVAVSLRIHSGRLVDIIYTITESMRDTGTKEADAGETTTGQGDDS
ncbi:MAG: hypothetical protein FWF68_04395 [Spirochaetes bacterium]|nr:hypothetical protein [Brevinematales bacterium]MCL1958820.1 hypothetical protein [Spirochaetota bacterium]